MSGFCLEVVLGTLKKVKESHNSCVQCWKLDNFLSYKLYGRIKSRSFLFGTGSWQLIINQFQNGQTQFHVIGPNIYPENGIFIKLSVGDSESKMIHEAEQTWAKFKGEDFHLISLETVDIMRVLHPDGSLSVTCKLSLVPEGTANSSATAIYFPGEHECVGTLYHVGTRKTWYVPDFWTLVENERPICSDSFAFGTRQWHLHVSSVPGQSEEGSGAAAEKKILLSLKARYRQKNFSPFSWIVLLKNDQGTVLRSTDGVCKKADDHVIVSLGSLSFVKSVLGSDGILRVVCELRLLKETTATSQDDSKADIVVRDLQKLLTSGESSDVTVSVKGERDFHVHRAVLVARTPLFAAMFEHNDTGTVTIADCEPDIFERFLQHVYTGKVEDLHPRNAISLYQVASKYQVNELKLDCLECLKEDLSIESFFPTIRLALPYCETELTQLAKDFFARNMPELVSSGDWPNFTDDYDIVANEMIMEAFKFPIT